MSIKRLIAGLAATPLVAALALPLTAFAATTVVVTPTNTQGWSTADTRANGHVSFVNDSSALLGTGALSLKTDLVPPNTGTDKAQYLHSANIALSDVTNLSYATKQNSATFPQGDPSYQLLVNLNGTSGFTTFVYEPYEQTGAVVTPGEWQTWDVDAGQFWSSRSVTCSNGAVVAGGGGAPFYSLSQIETMCPNAVVSGFGVNIGSNNPGYDTEADAVVFNDTTYDFETKAYTATNKDECKDGGWKNFQTAYKNQGDCVSAVASSGKANGNPEVMANNPTF